jgi:hypothetical protein
MVLTGWGDGERTPGHGHHKSAIDAKTGKALSVLQTMSCAICAPLISKRAVYRPCDAVEPAEDMAGVEMARDGTRTAKSCLPSLEQRQVLPQICTLQHACHNDKVRERERGRVVEKWEGGSGGRGGGGEGERVHE